MILFVWIGYRRIKNVYIDLSFYATSSIFHLMFNWDAAYNIHKYAMISDMWQTVIITA